MIRTLEPSRPQADDCNPSSLAKTASSVNAALSDYFAARPNVNQALIEITRQPEGGRAPQQVQS